MTTIQYLNVILLNAIAWFAFNYFWSFWNFKLFKPYLWLDKVKKKKLSKSLIKMERTFKDRNRFYTLWFQLNRIKTSKIPGDIAEFGVYRGETAAIIREVLPDHMLYLFDSFVGFPKQVIREDCDGTVRSQTVNFENTSKEKVLRLMGNSNKVVVKKGVFPETTQGMEDCTFAFVHLDADLYQSTMDGLQFFYPRLSPGGALLIHDYHHNWEGVTKAVDEFSNEIPEVFIEIPDMYGSVLLVKNHI